MASSEVKMNSRRQQIDALKRRAVQQVVECGIPVVDVATNCGISKHTVYGWVQRALLTGRSTLGSTARPARQLRHRGSSETGRRRVVDQRGAVQTFTLSENGGSV